MDEVMTSYAADAGRELAAEAARERRKDIVVALLAYHTDRFGGMVDIIDEATRLARWCEEG